jgi:HNH endonuclease
MGQATRTAHSRKLALFQDGIAGFERTFPGLIGKQFPNATAMYVCPICARAFSVEAIDDGELTEDHVPPRSIGHRLAVLVCKRCNNTAGHGIEADMRKAENIADVLAGRSSAPQAVRIRLGPEGPDINAIVQSTPEGIILDGQPKRNSPLKHAAFFAEMERLAQSRSLDWSLNMEFHRDHFSLHKMRVAWLKAGYLIAFAVFGYKFAFCRALAIVREQIADPAKRLIMLSGGLDPDGDTSRYAIIVVKVPRELAGAVGVTMGRHFVLFPGTGRDTDFYERLLAFRRAGGTDAATLTGDILSWPNRPLYLSDTATSRATPAS